MTLYKVPLRPDNHTSVIRFLNTNTFHVFYVIYRCKITEISYTTGENKILPEQYVLIAALVVYLNLQVPGLLSINGHGFTLPMCILMLSWTPDRSRERLNNQRASADVNHRLHLILKYRSTSKRSRRAKSIISGRAKLYLAFTRSL
jgi:hypothetical protein